MKSLLKTAPSIIVGAWIVLVIGLTVGAGFKAWGVAQKWELDLAAAGGLVAIFVLLVGGFGYFTVLLVASGNQNLAKAVTD